MPLLQVNTLWSLNKLAKLAQRVALACAPHKPELASLADTLGAKVRSLLWLLLP